MVNVLSNIQRPPSTHSPKTTKSLDKKRAAIQEVLEKSLNERSSYIASTSTRLPSKAVHPDSYGWWNWITTLFKRIFSSQPRRKASQMMANPSLIIADPSLITDGQKVQAENIENFIDGVKDKLKKFKALSKEYERIQNDLKGKFPSKDTYKSSLDYFEKILGDLQDQYDEGLKGELDEIKNNQLDNIKDQANQLASEHQLFSHLVDEINQLENNLKHSLSRIKFSIKLFTLEEALSNYCNDQTWENCEKIHEIRADIENGIAKLLKKDNSFLVDDPRAKKFLKKTSFNHTETIQFIKIFFPGLYTFTERLWNSALKIKQERLEKSENQINAIFYLFKKNEEQIRRLDALAEIAEGKSIGAQFSKIIHQFFYGKSYFQEETTKAKRAQKKIYDQFVKIDKFYCDDEMQWIKQAKPTFRKKLESLQQNRALMEAANLLRELDVQLKNQNILVSPPLQKLMGDLMTILQDVADLHTDLPEDKDNTSELEQLKIYLDHFFPPLCRQNKQLFAFIDLKQLSPMLNQMIKDLTDSSSAIDDSITPPFTPPLDQYQQSDDLSSDDISFDDLMQQAIEQKRRKKEATANLLSGSEVDLTLIKQKQKLLEVEEIFETRLAKLPIATPFERIKKEILSDERPFFMNSTEISIEERECLIEISRRYAMEPDDTSVFDFKPRTRIDQVQNDPPSDSFIEPPSLSSKTEVSSSSFIPPPPPPPLPKPPQIANLNPPAPCLLTKTTINAQKTQLKKPPATFNLEDLVDQIVLEKISVSQTFDQIKIEMVRLDAESISFRKYFQELLKAIENDRIKENDIPQEIKQGFSEEQNRVWRIVINIKNVKQPSF